MKKFSDKSLSIMSIVVVGLAYILFVISLFAAKPYCFYTNIAGWICLSTFLDICWALSQRREKALEEIIQKLLEAKNEK